LEVLASAGYVFDATSFRTEVRPSSAGSYRKENGIMEIVNNGVIESDDQLMELTEEYGQVVIPNDNQDLDLTHWWVIRDDGADVLYVGTPETFTTYIRERNGGVQ
jgi:hypothetical protein